MHALRSARFLARLVLAWFVLAMGVAIASPMVQPRGLDFICVGTGLKLLQQDDDGDAKLTVRLDCPLCSTVAAPPPPAAGLALLPAVHEQAVAPIRATHLATAPIAPPARGPPAHESA